MKSLLMATQFSEACINATNYAVGLAKQMQIQKIILLNTWKPLSVNTKNVLTSVAINGILKETSEAQLKAEEARIRSFCPSYIEIETISKIGFWEESITDLYNKKDVAYIVIGVAEDSKTDNEKTIRNCASNISLSSKIPVVIVPNYCSFNQVTKTLLLNNTGDLEESLENKSIDVFLDMAQPELEVVNFEVDINSVNEENEKNQLDTNTKIMDDAINDFAFKNQVQLIINFAKKSSTVLKNDVSKKAQKILYKTRLPLMVM